MIDSASLSGAQPLSLSVTSAPGPDWDDFVRGRPEATAYMRSRWTLLTRDVFRVRAHYLQARDAAGTLVGVLPVVQQRSLLGNFATSVPYFNYGGALATNDDIALQLMNRARELARDAGCSYLELRDLQARPDAVEQGWQVRTDKVTMVLSLPASADELGKRLGSKLRSQIKRAGREGVQTRTGGLELLDAFYDVFCRNMHELGTPVYPKRFFHAILEQFAADTRLVVIEQAGKPLAGGFLVFDGRRAEIPWACCHPEAKPLGINMRLYWDVLVSAIERGCDSFDFGRSSVDSGTFRFKQQWGAQPLPLHWYRWDRSPAAADAPRSSADGRLMRLATAIWQRMPLRLANALGPWVSPALPW
jgi:FemAB-related protein (PEP-CTERM system-associated)